MNNNTKSITNGLFWTFMEQTGSQGISLIISIILARLIAPEEYGVISAVHIFTSIASVFVTGGIAHALIQKKDADDLDYSSMFYYNTTFSIFLYFVVFFSAPYLVRILNSSYDYSLLTIVLRVSGLSFVFSSFNSFYRTRLVRELQFKKTFIITLSGTVLSAAVGIYMAYEGYGVWALVAQSIISNIVNSILLVVFSKWRPKLCFSFARLKPMLKYGYKLMFSSLLTTIYLDANSLVIGNQYDSSALAYYKKGLNFPKLIVSNTMSSINTVMFPVMTKLTTREENIGMIKKFNRFSSFIIAPLMFGFAAVAPAFVEVVLGNNWLPCVPFLQLACFDYAVQPIGISNLQYWKAAGHATLYLMADIIKKIISILLLVVAVTVGKGVIYIAVFQVIATIISTSVNLIPQKKLLNYSMLQQIKDVLPQYLMSLVMFIIVYFMGKILHIHPAFVLLIQIVLGVVLYILMAKLFKMQEYYSLKSILLSKLKNNK